MKKILLLVFISYFVCMNSFGEEINLQKAQTETPPSEGNPKAPALYSVAASLENEVLSLFFTPSASCQVVITDSQTNTVVYSNSFGVATGQVINLSTLPAREYELSIYAFGTWWEGDFVLVDITINI